jgi:hypothetical protein
MSANASGGNNKRLFMILGIGCAAIVVLCICVVVFMVLIGGTTVFGVLGVTQPAADAGEAFMTALKNSDYAGAYALCAPDLQTKLVNAQGLQRLVEGGKARPTKWSFNSRNIDNGQAELTGTVTMVGAEGTVSLSLIQVGDQWKIIAFNLKPN